MPKIFDDILLPGVVLNYSNAYSTSNIEEIPAKNRSMHLISQIKVGAGILRRKPVAMRISEIDSLSRAEIARTKSSCHSGRQASVAGGRQCGGGSLALAAGIGYTATPADAANTPFRSQIADSVAINASLQHCDDMQAVLREGARRVKPNGLLIAGRDPQLTARTAKVQPGGFGMRG